MQPVTELITAAAALIDALAWPAIVLFLVIRFRESLGDFMANLSEFSLKAPGIEASARRQQIEAAVAVGAAIATSPSADSDPHAPARAAAELAQALPGQRGQRSLQGSVALWVDDQPDNNRYERQALEALGVIVDIATSTDEALERLRMKSADIVISDMARPPDRQAGYALLDAMRTGGDHTPFVIYSGSRSAAHSAEARARGAIGSTNAPQELVSIITQALHQRRTPWNGNK
ncbi:response regulator [Nocardioides sp. YIM 152588]|uniref:response regulator n=1 Tax=Nocardioides sp. YIM 152588 TaxID=3158259 RepID=UPI0032E3C480